MVSFPPASVAFTDPPSATVAFMAASIATGASRVLKLVELCASAPRANNIAAAIFFPMPIGLVYLCLLVSIAGF